jgi:hypothetical protein
MFGPLMLTIGLYALARHIIHRRKKTDYAPGDERLQQEQLSSIAKVLFWTGGVTLLPLLLWALSK